MTKIIEATSELASYADALWACHTIFLPNVCAMRRVRDKDCVIESKEHLCVVTTSKHQGQETDLIRSRGQNVHISLSYTCHTYSATCIVYYSKGIEPANLGFFKVFIIKSWRSVPVESVYSKEPSARIKETAQLKNAYSTSSNSPQHYSEM